MTNRVLAVKTEQQESLKRKSSYELESQIDESKSGNESYMDSETEKSESQGTGSNDQNLSNINNEEEEEEETKVIVVKKPRKPRTKEKNHKCPHPTCTKRFSRKDNMLQHYNCHKTNGYIARREQKLSKKKDLKSQVDEAKTLFELSRLPNKVQKIEHSNSSTTLTAFNPFVQLTQTCSSSTSSSSFSPSVANLPSVSAFKNCNSSFKNSTSTSSSTPSNFSFSNSPSSRTNNNNNNSIPFTSNFRPSTVFLPTLTGPSNFSSISVPPSSSSSSSGPHSHSAFSTYNKTTNPITVTTTVTSTTSNSNTQPMGRAPVLPSIRTHFFPYL